MKKNKKSVIVQISTLPSPNALKWAGQQRSILSSLLLWTLWLCRVVSLLQICKFLYRKIAAFLKRFTVEKNSARINVPPIFCEIYFICWFAFFLFTYLGVIDGMLVRPLTYYFMFESIVWVLYYTIFRRFFEDNYSIYHELEYLTVLIILIPTQGLALSYHYGQPLGELISGLLGAASDTTPVFVRILGAMFAAIVIGMIISSFPTERVKKKSESPHMYVIGGGDVVQKRLYPAFMKSGCDKKEVDVYDLNTAPSRVEYASYSDSSEELCEKIHKQLDTHDVVWVETPSDTHISYLKKFLDSKAVLTVVEKPITIKRDELSYVESLVLDEDKRKKVFFLSYYVLEKGLPLYMTAAYNKKYKEYLNIEDEYLFKNNKIFLGALLSVRVSLQEGEDGRAWVREESFGGQLLETFIHNVLIATMFCRLPEYWSDVRLVTEENAISMTAKDSKTDIFLEMRKNVPAENIKRFAEFEFSGGSIYADFDRECVTVYFKGLDRQCTVSVKEQYISKYSILVDLVKRVERGECSSFEVDGLKNQIPVIRWLLKLCEDRNSSHADM